MAIVLVIDDSPDIHSLLEVRLRPEGVELRHAFDAEDGLRKAVELQPDLVLLDIDLPLITGLEVCQRLKADARTAGLQVIFLSGAHEVWTKVQGFDLGAIDYVTKPFDAAELRARVRSALRLKRFQDLLAMKAQVDGLTGVYNRAHMNQRLTEEVARSIRYRNVFTLVLTDLDHFKSINDRFGHPFGDTVLQAFADLLTRAVRATDVVCRYGGEEFALIFPETTPEGTVHVIDRVRRSLGELGLCPKGEVLRVTASWGVASSAMAHPGALTGPALIEMADQALYEAKHAGRNCARMWHRPIERLAAVCG
jgi:two-component system, cell cycle response regulator